MEPTELAERLKDVADDLDLKILVGYQPTGSDSWNRIEVRHASPYSDSSDGWDVEIKEGSL